MVLLISLGLCSRSSGSRRAKPQRLTSPGLWARLPAARGWVGQRLAGNPSPPCQGSARRAHSEMVLDAATGLLRRTDRINDPTPEVGQRFVRTAIADEALPGRGGVLVGWLLSPVPGQLLDPAQCRLPPFGRQDRGIVTIPR